MYGTAQALGKPVMMSEWGANAVSSTASDMSAGITLSERILKNEQQMHPASWVIWQAVDGGPASSVLGACDDVWGLACADLSAGSNQQVSYPARFWVMGNYSKFVRPGATVIGDHGSYAVLASPVGMTFCIVSHHGEVFEKDLGPRSATLASQIVSYDPDSTWTAVDGL